jgi:hypothetical protein
MLFRKTCSVPVWSGRTRTFIQVYIQSTDGSAWWSFFWLPIFDVLFAIRFVQLVLAFPKVSHWWQFHGEIAANATVQVLTMRLASATNVVSKRRVVRARMPVVMIFVWQMQIWRWFWLLFSACILRMHAFDLYIYVAILDQASTGSYMTAIDNSMF